MHFVGCLHRCTNYARSHKHQVQKIKMGGKSNIFIGPTFFSKLKNKLNVCSLIMLASLLLLLASLTVVVIESRKTKNRTQCGELLFVRIVERNILFNYLDSTY